MILVFQIDEEQRQREASARLMCEASELVRKCQAFGYVLTVEQKPTEPFAMGKYMTVVSVRPKREATK